MRILIFERKSMATLKRNTSFYFYINDRVTRGKGNVSFGQKIQFTDIQKSGGRLYIFEGVVRGKEGICHVNVQVYSSEAIVRDGWCTLPRLSTHSTKVFSSSSLRRVRYPCITYRQMVVKVDGKGHHVRKPRHGRAFLRD